MKWHDASPLPYLVIFIPLCLDLSTRLTGTIKHIRVSRSLPSHQRTAQQTKSNMGIFCLLGCTILYLNHWVIREQSLQEINPSNQLLALHIISCDLRVTVLKQNGRNLYNAILIVVIQITCESVMFMSSHTLL